MQEAHLISENLVEDKACWKRSVLFPAPHNWSKWISHEITSPDRSSWVVLDHQATGIKLLPQPEDKKLDTSHSYSAQLGSLIFESWEGGKKKWVFLLKTLYILFVCFLRKKKATLAIISWAFMSLFRTAYMTEWINCFEHSDPGSNFLIVCWFCFSCIVHLETKTSCGTATWLGGVSRNQSNSMVLIIAVVLNRGVSQWKDTVGLVGSAASGWQPVGFSVSPEASVDLEWQIYGNISEMLANRYRISNFIPERCCLFLKYPNHNEKCSKIFFSFIYLLAGGLALGSFKILWKVLPTGQYIKFRINETTICHF